MIKFLPTLTFTLLFLFTTVSFAQENLFEKNYQTQSPKGFKSFSVNPDTKIMRGWDQDTDKIKMLEEGYDLMGFSGFSGPNVSPDFARAHGEKLKADLILIYDRQVNENTRASAIQKARDKVLAAKRLENKGEITLCPIGPLTNVAAAIDLDPDFCKNLKNIVIMGGSLRAGGNITPAAEANIYHDPHAADFVFENGSNITMVGLDVTDRVVCSREYFKALALESPQIGSLLNQMADFYITFYESINKINGCGMHDPTALIKCAEPSFFKTEAHKIKVILSGERMGETISDLNLKRPNFEICVDVDISAVKDDFFSNVAKLK